MQQKTGRPVQFEITANARASFATWLLRRGGTPEDFVFPSRIHPGQPMSTRQYGQAEIDLKVRLPLNPTKNESLRSAGEASQKHRSRQAYIVATNCGLREPLAVRGADLTWFLPSDFAR